LDVVLLKRRDGHSLNQHKLQPPLHKEVVHGPIVLTRMDETATPQDFSLEEYRVFQKQEIAEFDIELDSPLDNDSAAVDIHSADDDEAASASDGDYSVGEDDVDEHDDEMDAVFSLILQKVVEKFQVEHGREPTEQEIEVGSCRHHHRRDDEP
jgi:hypothetical protein